MDALKSKTTEEVKELLKTTGKSQNKIAREIGISSAVLSNIVNGKTEEISLKTILEVRTYFKLPTIPMKTTGNVKLVHAALDEARRRGRLIGMSQKTGFGKTVSLRSYVKRNPGAIYVLCSPAMNRKSFLEEILAALGLKVSTKLDRSIKRIAENLTRHGDLLILDEADKLPNSCYPLIQQIYDRLDRSAGIVLSGTDFLRRNLQNGARLGWKGFDEFYDRIERWLTLSSPTLDEVSDLAAHAGITSRSALEFLHRAVRNFRQLNNYLEAAVDAAVNGYDINDPSILKRLPVG